MYWFLLLHLPGTPPGAPVVNSLLNYSTIMLKLIQALFCMIKTMLSKHVLVSFTTPPQAPLLGLPS